MNITTSRFTPLLFACALNACAYGKMAGSSVSYKLNPSVQKRSVADGEENSLVHGWLARSLAEENTKLHVVATTQRDESTVPAVVMPVAESGHFVMSLPPADYEFLVYEDKDEDGDLSAEEILGYRSSSFRITTGGPSLVTGLEIPVGAPLPTRTTKLVLPSESIEVKEYSPQLNVAEEFVASRYAAENAHLGMYRPNEFFGRFTPLQFVDAPDFTDERMPLVLVHGIDDTPAIFEAFDSRHSRAHFQEWFYYYPTGVRLPGAAALLNYLYFSGQVVPRSGDAALIAHSMGGLVARGALQFQKPGPPATRIVRYASFDTPYGGVDSANIGVTRSPVRVPSWVDVASGSKYLDDLFPPLPSWTTFLLYAGNSDGDGDGTIAIESQLFRSAKMQASQVRVFDATHVGVMGTPAALEALLSELAPLSPSRDTKAHTWLTGPARLARAAEFFRELHSFLRESKHSFRVMKVAPGLERLVIGHGATQAVIQAAAGRNLRIDFVSGEYESLRGESWHQEGDSEEDSKSRQAEFFDAFKERLDGRFSSSTKETDLEEPPTQAAVLPPSPSKTTDFPPPVHLSAGLMANFNGGDSTFMVRIPLDFALYLGRFGMGSSLRLPLYAPKVKSSTEKVLFRPKGIGAGPRFRWGSKNSILSLDTGINLNLEWDSVATLDSDGTQILRVKFVTAPGVGANFYGGLRLGPDLYLRLGGELGTYFNNVSVVLDGEDYVLWHPAYFNTSLGVEVRIP